MVFYVTAKLFGGWGNQMFIVASMLGYAERHGHRPVLLMEPPKEHFKSQLYVLDFFSVPVCPELATQCTWISIKENPGNAFTYTSLPNIQGNVCLEGCFQSEMYFPFQQIRPRIPQFSPTFNSDLLYNNWSKTFFLHIRRGDYLHPANVHHCIPVEPYIRKVLPLFEKDLTCFVVSDDIAWCKMVLPTLFSNTLISWLFCSAETSDAETLFWMSMCGAGGICANSTFSWWGAYFLRQQNKSLYMPYPWGSPPLPEARDLYPPWSTKVNWID